MSHSNKFVSPPLFVNTQNAVEATPVSLGCSLLLSRGDQSIIDTPNALVRAGSISN